MDHGIEKTATYLESPVRAVTEAGERLDWRLDGDAPLPFPLLDELREDGYTHYVIAPFIYAEGLVNAISWATARPGGFGADELHFLDDVLPALSTIVEQKAMRRFVTHMLTTYVGAEAGRLILEGQVRRGDVRSITAALMLVDLRDFSLLSDRMKPRAVIGMLNEYFDASSRRSTNRAARSSRSWATACSRSFASAPTAARPKPAAPRSPQQRKAWPRSPSATGRARAKSGCRAASRCITAPYPMAISGSETASISP